MAFDPTSSGVDVILALGAFAALWSLVRSWRSFVDPDFTASDRQLATQVAVFLVTPVLVLLHELGHIGAAAAVGAHVTGLQYRLFEGAVGIEGDLTPVQDWFISVAGTLVVVVLGLAMLAGGALSTRLRRPFRHVLILGGIFQLLFALVGYPLFSATSDFGDWLVIYDFSATPVLSGLTAAVHVALLLGLWRWWRNDLRARLFAVAHGGEAELDALRAAVRREPAAVAPRLALANHFAVRGDLGMAGWALDDGLGAVHPPEAARLHLARARLALHRGRWNPALLAARAGLDALPSSGADHELTQRLWANQGLALAQMDRFSLALAAFDHLDEGTASDVRVRYCRGLSRLATGDEAGGRADLAAVVDALPEHDLLRRWAEARLAGRDPRRGDDQTAPGRVSALGSL